MEQQKALMYPPDRAIEFASTLPGFLPVRLFAMLYPLWLVEIDAEQEITRPYALIEEYIERGMQEATLHTVEEMVHFFGLSTPIVSNVLHFLATIQHVQELEGGRWVLTQRGVQSLAAGEKSMVKQEKGQYLYFDGFCSRPLLKEHYHRLQVKDDIEAESVTRTQTGGHRFYRLHCAETWNTKALDDLVHGPDPAQYNVPAGLKAVKPTGVSRVYMPMYIVETRKQHAMQRYYLVYTHMKGHRDAFFEQIINQVVSIQRTLDAMPKEENLHDVWSKWLRSNNLAYLRPEQTPEGLWRVVLPEELFQSPAYPPRKIGTYYKDRGYFLQLWCNNTVLRRKAVADHVLYVLSKGYKTLTREYVQNILQQRTDLLQVSAVSLRDLLSWARERKAQDEVLQKLAGWLEEKSS